MWIPKNIYSWWASSAGTSCALKHLLNLVGSEDLSNCIVGGRKSMPWACSHSSMVLLDVILLDEDTGALFDWQVEKKGLCWNWMIILSEMIASFRAQPKSQMTLAIIIMWIHTLNIEVKFWSGSSVGEDVSWCSSKQLDCWSSGSRNAHCTCRDHRGCWALISWETQSFEKSDLPSLLLQNFEKINKA